MMEVSAKIMQKGKFQNQQKFSPTKIKVNMICSASAGGLN